MQIIVVADGVTQKEFQDKQIPAGVTIQFVATVAEIAGGADGFFYLLEEEDYLHDVQQIRDLPGPVFIHAVATVLKDLPANCIRICGWRGFLLQETMEISVRQDDFEKAAHVLNGLQWNFHQVPDIIGLVAPRTTALLINEAYLILDHDTTRKDEIDLAIKLAANFSSGPFELAEMIGLKKIFNLLTHLKEADPRYSPAPILQKEISDLAVTT